MCEPITLSTAAVYAMAAGAAVSAYAAYSGAQNTKAQANYQSKVAANNAQSAEWAAQDAAKRGEQAQIDSRRKYAALQGTQRTALASRGLDVGEGSALAILGDTELFQGIDAGRIEDNSNREQWAIRNQKANYQAQSELSAWDANSTNPALNAGMSLIGSSGQVADRWYKNKQAA